MRKQNRKILVLVSRLADPDAVSPEFKSQVQQNCLTKLILRTDDPDEVDFWSAVAGTRDAIEQSYQVQDVGPITMRTGAGNSRITKQMKVEHDTFKQLKIGQAVMLQKAPAREDLLFSSGSQILRASSRKRFDF